MKRYAYAETVKAKVPPIPPVVAGGGPATDKGSQFSQLLGKQAALTERQREGNKPSGIEIENGLTPPPDTCLGREGIQPLRLSIVAAPPLTDPAQPNGGLITELTMAALQRANVGGVTQVWNKDKMGQITQVMGEHTASLAVPWETPDCDKPQDLSSEHASVCDGALISAPLFQVPIVFLAKADSDFDFKTDDSVVGRTLCVHAGLDVTDLNGENRKWLVEKKVTLVRPATLIDCLNAVERGEADALVGSEAESRFAMNRLGLSEAFKMAERPLATHGIHIILPKDRPEAQALLDRINQGIADLRKSGAYSAIIAKHLPAFMPNAIAKAQ